MNASWNEFEELVRQARQEPIPPIDISDRVAESIRPRVRARVSEATDWTLWLASALSVAAAVLVMAWASYQGVLSADPLAELLSPVIPVIQ
jgi:hypothetical protein